MKKIVSMLLALVFALSLVGCGKNQTKKELLQYINSDLVKLVDIETEALESYRSVLGENYTDDLTAYTELTENTIPLARKLNEEALNAISNISNEEILEVHKYYVDYAAKFLSAVGMVVSALETQDMAQLSEANEKLNAANLTAIDFATKLKALAKEYNVTLES